MLQCLLTDTHTNMIIMQASYTVSTLYTVLYCPALYVLRAALGHMVALPPHLEAVQLLHHNPRNDKHRTAHTCGGRGGGEAWDGRGHWRREGEGGPCECSTLYGAVLQLHEELQV